MREGGRSGGVLLCLDWKAVVAGINEIGRFTNVRRRKLLALQLFLRDPPCRRQNAEARGKELCSLGVLHPDHPCMMKGLFQSIREEADFRSNWIIGFEQRKPRNIAPIVIVSVFEKEEVPQLK